MTVVTVFYIAVSVSEISSLSSRPSRRKMKGWIAGLKNVQISEKLFFALLKYHLVEMDDVLPEIKKGLEEKLEAMVKHDLYTKYKTAPTEEEREKARQEYLEKVGMQRSFRW